MTVIYEVLVNGRLYQQCLTREDAKRVAATFNRRAAQLDRGHLYKGGRATIDVKEI